MARFKNAIRMFLLGLMGTAFGSGSCQNVARLFNPCAGAGDVFTPQVCTQTDYLDLFDGFAPNYDRDPFCTLANTCPGTITEDTTGSAGDGVTGAFDPIGTNITPAGN